MCDPGGIVLLACVWGAREKRLSRPEAIGGVFFPQVCALKTVKLQVSLDRRAHLWYHYPRAPCLLSPASTVGTWARRSAEGEGRGGFPTPTPAQALRPEAGHPAREGHTHLQPPVSSLEYTWRTQCERGRPPGFCVPSGRSKSGPGL